MSARDAIQAIVDELEEMISEDITLDSRVHARVIGARGKGIRKIMDEFKVCADFSFFFSLPFVFTASSPGHTVK